MFDSVELHHQFLVGGGVNAASTFAHAVFVAAGAAVFRSSISRVTGSYRFFRDSFVMVALVLWLLLSHAIGIAMWAATFQALDLFPDFETALYYSAACYTTIGFGDILLPEEWRLLAGAEGANGLILFGLSAAFLFDAAAKLRLGGAARD